MPKETGGYFQLETFKGEAYHGDLFRFNLGRTAAAWFLKQAGCRKVHMPFFMCESVISAIEKTGIEIEYYHIDRGFRSVIAGKSLSCGSSDTGEGFEDGEWLYVNNSYGFLSDDYLKELKSKYGNVLADNTHAFFRRPADGVATVYSVRKYFGVPDGAYLYAGDRKTGFVMPEETDMSHGRFAHLLGRFEGSASDYYRDMLDTAESFNDMPPMRMSTLTENLMNAVDYGRVLKTRNENFAVLEKCLSKYNGLTVFIPEGLKKEGPFAYPFLIPDGAALRKELISRKYYIPRYWDTVADKVTRDSIEYDYSENILPLPCDQRCTAEDMKEMADVILGIIQ